MRLRGVLLPVLAAGLVGGVLGVQAANGGGDFVPARAADPCLVRAVTPMASGIEGLGEHLVLLALDGAACRLHVTREALVLDLAGAGEPTQAQVDAVRAALLDAADRLRAEHALPKASALVDEALDGAHLPGIVTWGIRALPDSLIDAALKTDDVLRRTIEGLDVRALLVGLHDPDGLTGQIDSAVTKAVRDALLARLRDLLP